MIALDTNVVVRVVTEDDPEQARAAREAMAGQSLWVAKTVLLETEWVLRYCYKLGRNPILQVFQHLLGYPKLEVEDRPAVLQALGWYEEGLDFADALHLSASPPLHRLATFDKDLVRRASQVEGCRPTELLNP
ncbi:MAG: type II toxin-antitoxin system VapC family toxin [Deltaproteobacteria bacterium]|nr:type II toxin-antitoxin system VapC family toxin [Deltaproteobacteria bacterium]